MNPPRPFYLIDVVNHLEFPDGEKLMKKALPVASRLAQLKEKAQASKIPVIYALDNIREMANARIVTSASVRIRQRRR